ncbi:MAG: hypothetical protein U0531_01930 [Dehalococcoidia bacterium]
MRLFDDESWATGEAGPPTWAVVAALLPAAAEAAGTTAWATGDSQPLARAVAFGLTRPLPDLLGPPAPATVAALAAATAAAMNGHSAREALGFAAQAARTVGSGPLADAILDAGGVAQASGGQRLGPLLAARFHPMATMKPWFRLSSGSSSAPRAPAGRSPGGEPGRARPETAAVAGAICAAILPPSLPDPWGVEVERVNGSTWPSPPAACSASEP